MKQILVLVGVLAAILVSGAVWSQTRAPSEVAGCQYNSTPPTLANLQTSVLQCDVNGKILLH